jgi:chromatin assembly factor 1 subunit B
MAESAAAATPPVTLRTIEIRWHWSAEREEGVMSVDFHPTLPRLVTAGADGNLKVWEIVGLRAALHDQGACPSTATKFMSMMTLPSNNSSGAPPMANVARWSPHGVMIASAYVTGDVKVWRLNPNDETKYDESDDRRLNVEHWAIHRSFSMSKEAVDVAFSPTSSHIVTGDYGGTVSVHHLDTGVLHHTIQQAHDLSVHGVAWDPLDAFLHSVGNDRQVKYFKVLRSDKKPLSFEYQARIEKVNGATMFKGEQSCGFARRASWSPDGAMFAVPCGWAKQEDKAFRNCAYLFSRSDLGKPAACLAARDERHIAGVAFAPCVFEPFAGDADALRRDAKGAWGPAEYRYALAVWSKENVVVYTSDAAARYCAFSDLHYDTVTDVRWSGDASLLGVASLDGYMTFMSFDAPIGKRFDIYGGAGFLSKGIAAVLRPIREAGEATELAISTEALQTRKKVHVAKKKKKRSRTPEEAAPPAEEQDAVDEDALAAMLD